MKKSNIDEQKVEWGIATLVLAAQSAMDHCEELAEAWRTGALASHDGKNGLRSNRNYDIAIRLRRSLQALNKEPPGEREREVDWMNPGNPRCPSMHGGQQCQWKAGHEGPHQECMEVWNHE